MADTVEIISFEEENRVEHFCLAQYVDNVAIRRRGHISHALWNRLKQAERDYFAAKLAVSAALGFD